jgi:hypothetical protein
MKAITVRQPWAWAIINAGKDIENRSWNTRIRGRVAIHAAQGMTREEYERGCKYIRKIRPKGKIPQYEDLERGEIVGTVEVIDCVRNSASPWFFGEYGFVLSHPKKLPEPIPCKGALSFWDVPKDIESLIKKANA